VIKMGIIIHRYVCYIGQDNTAAKVGTQREVRIVWVYKIEFLFLLLGPLYIGLHTFNCS